MLTIDDINLSVKMGQTNVGFLKKIYDKIEFINEKSVIKYYIGGLDKINVNKVFDEPKIYPFSFNLSQKTAVNNTFSNNISVIEGPPGTGKTQTILNIIANAILNNKTVAVLSNNNSATDNVFEKLQKYNLDALCAKLGKKDNIKKFLEGQSKLKSYPNDWKLDESKVKELKNDLLLMNSDIESYLYIKNEIAILRQEVEELKLEHRHFKESVDFSKIEKINLPDFDADKLHEFLLYLNKQKNRKDTFSKYVQFWTQIKFKFRQHNLFKNTITNILDCIELMYYEKKRNELEEKLSLKKNRLTNLNLENTFNIYTEKSMLIFKDFVYRNYNNKNIYDDTSIKNTEKLIKDYPIILSTTYSLLNCINKDFMFDYMIIDESSQVDLVSSFSALTIAKNVVIVGDSKQLPNIVDGERKKEFDEIFNKYGLEEKYNYTKNSLLDLTKKVFNIVEPVVLREHYRCHPQIINFCNKKFYDNQLIILSEKSNDEPIKHYKCVKGNHARKNNKSQFNDRQAQIIKDEVIPQQNIDIDNDSIGIITPYTEQKKYLKKIFDNDNLAIDTVYGFQGREKDIIIFSTVADYITRFLDDPNSINVAVSRAVNKLYLVTPYEYKSKDNSNIANLISYISYNNFEIVDSKINSVFDLLYKVNEKEKIKYLKTHLFFSKYPSEIIMYNVINEILKLDEFKTYSVKDKVYPLRKLVRDKEKLLTEEEQKFINHNSHVDFLIFNKFNKKPVLAIEVDGYYFHNNAKQKIRDQKKESILKKCEIPLLRFKTNECNEKDRLIKKLNEIISNN